MNTTRHPELDSGSVSLYSGRYFFPLYHFTLWLTRQPCLCVTALAGFRGPLPPPLLPAPALRHSSGTCAVSNAIAPLHGGVGRHGKSLRGFPMDCRIATHFCMRSAALHGSLLIGKNKNTNLVGGEYSTCFPY